jgi:hypothetical protein
MSETRKVKEENREEGKKEKKRDGPGIRMAPAWR